MAHNKQALKRVRTSEEARLRNKARRSAVKSSVRKASRQTDRAAVQKALAEASRRIDKAAKAGVIHKNAAARLRSRMTRRANRALAGSPS